MKVENNVRKQKLLALITKSGNCGGFSLTMVHFVNPRLVPNFCSTIFLMADRDGRSGGEKW